MRNTLASTLVSALVLGTAWTVPIPAVAAACTSTNILPEYRVVNVFVGATVEDKVTGFPPRHANANPQSGIVLHVPVGSSYSLTVPKGANVPTVTIPSNTTATVVVEPTALPSPTRNPARSDNVEAAPDDTLIPMMDANFASVSPSPPPQSATTAPGAAPTVTYEIKGEEVGRATLSVTQGDECVAIGVHVLPKPSDRFLASAGIGTSSVPKYTISTVTSPASFSPPSTATSTRVLKTENSGHGVSVPLLLNYQLTSNAHSNLFGTVGFFTNPGSSGGLVYGVSGGWERFLITLGVHSANVTDLAPGLHDNDVVPSGINTSVTRRVTGFFFAVSLPTALLSQLLNPVSGGSSNSGGDTSAVPSH